MCGVRWEGNGRAYGPSGSLQGRAVKVNPFLSIKALLKGAHFKRNVTFQGAVFLLWQQSCDRNSDKCFSSAHDKRSGSGGAGLCAGCPVPAAGPAWPWGSVPGGPSAPKCNLETLIMSSWSKNRQGRNLSFVLLVCPQFYPCYCFSVASGAMFLKQLCLS